MEEEIKIDDAWHMLMHYPNVWLGDYPEELYQAFLEIGREELVFHSKKQKTIEEITELMIRVKPGLRILRDEVVSAGRMGEHILLYFINEPKVMMLSVFHFLSFDYGIELC